MILEIPLTVCVVVLLDFPKSECKFSHPVNPAPHTSCCHVHLRRGTAAAETVRLKKKVSKYIKKKFQKMSSKSRKNLKVVVAQVLAIVVTPDVINVNLTFNIFYENYFQIKSVCDIINLV